MLTKLLLAFGLSALMLSCVPPADEASPPSEELQEDKAAGASEAARLIDDGPTTQCLPRWAFTGPSGGLCSGPGLDGPPTDNPDCCSGRAAYICPAAHEPSEERCL